MNALRQRLDLIADRFWKPKFFFIRKCYFVIWVYTPKQIALAHLPKKEEYSSFNNQHTKYGQSNDDKFRK